MKKPTLKDKTAAALDFASPKPEKKTYFNAPAGHKRLTINLPEALHKQLRQVALDRDLNATDIIVSLLIKDLNT